MSFLKKLFGRSGGGKTAQSVDSAAQIEAAMALVTAQAIPCLRMVTGGDGASRLGGAPEMSGDWPRADGRPMSLVAQLDLAEVRSAGGPEWLPANGRLLFFYDLDASPWGLGPEDAGTFLVRHETSPAAALPPPADLDADAVFPACPVRFEAALSYPNAERAGVDWSNFPGRAEGQLERLLEALEPAEPAHQVGGYALAVQDDEMDEQCQLVTNGLYLGGGDAYSTAEAEALRPGAADWRLLLQIDSDGKAGMMWGDAGRLYFWVREQDARAGDFSKAWVILQCY